MFYLWYRLSNNYCYSCHHTNTTCNQISTLNYLYVSVDSHLFYPHQKMSLSFFWDTTMEIKPHSFFVLSPAIAPHIYIYIYIYNFTLQFSFWLVFYLGKLCKFLIYWGYFCDGKRYLVTYKPNTIGQTYKSITYVRINQRDLKLSANVMFINFILEGCICSV